MDQPDQTQDTTESGATPLTAADVADRADLALTEADDIVVVAAGRAGDTDAEKIRRLIALKRDPAVLRLVGADPSMPVSEEAQQALTWLEAAVAELSGDLGMPVGKGAEEAGTDPDPSQLDRFVAWFDGDTDAALAGAAASAQRKRDAAPVVVEDSAPDDGASDLDKAGTGAKAPPHPAGARRDPKGRAARTPDRRERRRRGPLGRIARILVVAALIFAVVIVRDSHRRHFFSEALQLPRLTAIGGLDDFSAWLTSAGWRSGAELAIAWLADDVWSIADGGATLVSDVFGSDPEDPPEPTTIAEAPPAVRTSPTPAPEKPTRGAPVPEESIKIVPEGRRRDPVDAIDEQLLAARTETARLRREVVRLNKLLRASPGDRSATPERSATDEGLVQALERERALRAIYERRLAAAEAAGNGDTRVAALNEQVRELRRQLSSLQALLDEAEARDAANRMRITTLGAELNAALARVAAAEKREIERQEEEARRLRREVENTRNDTTAGESTSNAPETHGEAEDFTVTHTIGNRAANAREGPGTSFARIVTLRPGTPLALKKAEDGWGQFTFEEGSGARRDAWIFMSLTRAAE